MAGPSFGANDHERRQHRDQSQIEDVCRDLIGGINFAEKKFSRQPTAGKTQDKAQSNTFGGLPCTMDFVNCSQSNFLTSSITVHVHRAPNAWRMTATQRISVKVYQGNTFASCHYRRFVSVIPFRQRIRLPSNVYRSRLGVEMTQGSQ